MPDGNWANNERLEFLGDAVLDLVVADYLYFKFPGQKEGFLTATRAKIVQRESLNRVGNALHLDAHVRASTHTPSHNSYISGNALEALVGAIYIDGGFNHARRFIIERIIEDHFDLDQLVKSEINFKSRLIEWTQKYRVNIEYRLVGTRADADNNPIFTTAVILGELHAGSGEGYSKKESHQSASKAALERLEADVNFRQQVLSSADTPEQE